MDPKLGPLVGELGRPIEKPIFELDPKPGPDPELWFSLQQKLQLVQMLLTVFLTLASIIVLMLISPIFVLIEVIVLMFTASIPSRSLDTSKGAHVISRERTKPQKISPRALWREFMTAEI